MKLDLYQQSGEKKGTVEVKDALFKAPVNDELMRLVFLRERANARQANAHTKTRGEVRGGGRKPWKQKHTGRARHGSIRSPIWPGGGITFGPRNNRNFSKRLPRNAYRIALFSALSQKASENSIFALDQFSVTKPKTKEFAAFLSKLPFKRSLLIVLPESDFQFKKAAGNIPNVHVTLMNSLHLSDLLKYEKVMFMEKALEKAEKLYLKS